ncbi:MAG: Ig-like domain-containing protein, partial [Bacteroidales bacterium]|nr:Ig-like domain-containing protein [Bacteroidales bacterium]
GIPNLLSGGGYPYQKHFEVYITEGGSGYQDEWVIVEGYKTREQTFTSVSPELPLIILRDPPADHSYSYLNTTTSTCLNVRLYFEESLSEELTLEASLGLDLGFINLGGSIQGSLEVGIGVNSSTELGFCVSTNNSYTTTTGESYPGGASDIYGGVALNLLYAITDILTVNENCEVEIDQGISWGCDGFATTYLYTDHHIKDDLIPELEWFAENTPYPDSVQFFLDSRNLWQQVLDLNDSLKATSTFVVNRSFDAGPQYEYSETTTLTGSTMIEFYTYIDESVALEAGVQVLGMGASGSVKVKTGLKVGESLTSSITTTNTVGYHLEDQDPGDYFSVDIKADTVFGTPVFELVSGTTSCPWEHPSQPREGVSLSINPSVQFNIPPTQAAPFTLYLGNESQSDEQRTYYLSTIQESNPDGAVIKVNGQTIEDHLEFTIPAWQIIQATLTVEIGPLAYDYQNLKLRLYSSCGDSQISDTVMFTVHYISPCSDVTIYDPANNWLINQSDNNLMQVIITDYDINNPNLTAIKFQHTKLGEYSWITDASVPLAQLPQDYLIVDWDVSYLSDGEYEIRAVAECSNSTKYSDILTGLIDRTPPDPFGIPEPSDGILDPGDEISVIFNDPIDCTTATIQNCTLKYQQTGQAINIQVACSDNKIIITPSIPEFFIENQTLIACVSGIEDLNGNVMSVPECWTFYVDLGPLKWYPSSVSEVIPDSIAGSFSSNIINNSNQVTQYTITGYQDWITPYPLSGQIMSKNYLEIDFDISAQLDPGLHLDTVFVETSGWPPEPIYIEIHKEGGITNNIVFSNSWNWFSLNVQSNDMLVNTVLSSLTPNPMDNIKTIINMQGQSSIFYEGVGWWPNIIMYPESMYMLYLLEADSLKFTGIPVDLGNTNIPVYTGWNWVGYLPQSPLETNEALSSLNVSNLDQIKNMYMSATYYSGFGWFGTLDSLHPCNGYKLKLANNDTLVYPDPGLESLGKNNFVNFQHPEGSHPGIVSTDWKVHPNQFEFNGEVIARVYFGNMPVNNGGILAAFSGNECRGIASGGLNGPNGYVYIMMCYSNRFNGETLSFKYLDTDHKVVYSLNETVVFTPDMQVGNAVNPFEFHINPANEYKILPFDNSGQDNTQEEFTLLQNIPNPFSHKTQIGYVIPEAGDVFLRVYNSYGVEVKTLAMYHQSRGIYRVEFDGSLLQPGIYLYKLEFAGISRKDIKSRKMIISNR